MNKPPKPVIARAWEGLASLGLGFRVPVLVQGVGFCFSLFERTMLVVETRRSKQGLQHSRLTAQVHRQPPVAQGCLES